MRHAPAKKSLRLVFIATLLCLSSAVGAYAAAEDMPMDHSKMDHSQHLQEALGKNGGEAKKSLAAVSVPNVKMLRQDGTQLASTKVIGSAKPTVLAFIYTSCTTVCPLTSQIMSQVQDLLGSELANTSMVSISIDPEYDSPKRLAEYAKKYGAAPLWQHYTGTLADSISIQKAFNAYQGDKMNHSPLIFVNGGGKASWARLDGFPSAAEVVKELRVQIGG